MTSFQFTLLHCSHDELDDNTRAIRTDLKEFWPHKGPSTAARDRRSTLWRDGERAGKVTRFVLGFGLELG